MYPMGTIFQYVIMSKNTEGTKILDLIWSSGWKNGNIERDIQYSLDLLLKMKYEECWNPKTARRNLESLVHYCAQKQPDHLRFVMRLYTFPFVLRRFFIPYHMAHMARLHMDSTPSGHSIADILP